MLSDNLIKNHDKYVMKYRKKLINDIWKLGLYKLKKSIKSGSLETEFYYPIDWKSVDIDLFAELLKKGHKEGICILLDDYGFTRATVKFSIEKFEPFYMLNALNKLKKRLHLYNTIPYRDNKEILDELTSFLEREANYYNKYKDYEDNFELINEKEDNICKKIALYRLGYDVDPEYDNWLDKIKEYPNLFECDSYESAEKINLFYYKVLNCMEISHHINKQKRLTNEKLANKGDKLNVKGSIRKRIK